LQIGEWTECVGLKCGMPGRAVPYDVKRGIIFGRRETATMDLQDRPADDRGQGPKTRNRRRVARLFVGGESDADGVGG
jgi:hypothetical protein